MYTKEDCINFTKWWIEEKSSATIEQGFEYWEKNVRTKSKIDISDEPKTSEMYKWISWFRCRSHIQNLMDVEKIRRTREARRLSDDELRKLLKS